MKLTKTQFKEFNRLKYNYELDNLKPYNKDDMIHYLLYLISKQTIKVE